MHAHVPMAWVNIILWSQISSYIKIIPSSLILTLSPPHTLISQAHISPGTSSTSLSLSRTLPSTWHTTLWPTSCRGVWSMAPLLAPSGSG